MTTNIELVALDALQPNPKNPKLHAEDVIRASINRFGLIELPVIDARTGWLVSGHGRVETLRTMRANGDTPPPEVQVVDGVWMVPARTGWASRSDAEAEAALIALNRTGQLGGWDNEALTSILSELQVSQQLDGIGYDAHDLSLLLKQLDAQTQFTTDVSGAIDEFVGIAGVDALRSAQPGIYRRLQVVFASEADAKSFYEKLERVYDATERSMAWPVSIPKTPAKDFDE